MAGDWIPLRCDLGDDPAVIAIATATGLDEFGVVGRLHRLWAWANKHTTTGNARSVTANWVDRYLSAPGFAAAMVAAGWLADGPNGIEFPRFDRWNSQTAKQRALTARRVANHKARGNGAGNGASVSGALPTEEKEKRRGEEKNPPTPQGGEGTKSDPADKPAKPTKPAKPKQPAPDAAAAVPLPAELDAAGFRAAWAEWQADRKARRKPLTELAARQQLAELAPLGPDRAAECVRVSIRNGWAGLFPERFAAPPQRSPPPPPPADFWERKKAEAAANAADKGDRP